jgi:hypothetical protein
MEVPVNLEVKSKSTTNLLKDEHEHSWAKPSSQVQVNKLSPKRNWCTQCIWAHEELVVFLSGTGPERSRR